MSLRRHWRFIVRDAYGYVIQNARVYVYQPGTTTAFLGTAYNAASGGSTVTNPFTTNAQGEVEAWFDTAQSVDVFVDDNTDHAYRAVDGSGVVVSFTAFTEKDEIDVSPEDVIVTIPAVGVAGDLITAIVNPFAAQTAVAGSTGKYADAGHTHPYTALTPAVAVMGRSAAGAGALTNPARSDHIHPLQVGLGRTSQFTPAANLNEQVIHTITVPANTLSAGSVFHIRAVLYWTNAATVSGLTLRVRWGGTAGVLLVTFPTMTSTATTVTDGPVTFDAIITFRTIGASGSSVGDAYGFQSLNPANVKTNWSSVITAAVAPDTTVDKSLDFTGQIATSNTGINYKVDNVSIRQVA